jgi:hypothetical protein
VGIYLLASRESSEIEVRAIIAVWRGRVSIQHLLICSFQHDIGDVLLVPSQPSASQTYLCPSRLRESAVSFQRCHGVLPSIDSSLNHLKAELIPVQVYQYLHQLSRDLQLARIGTYHHSMCIVASNHDQCPVCEITILIQQIY